MRKKRLMELKPLKVMNRHIADAKKTEISLSPLEKKRVNPENIGCIVGQQ